MDWTGLDFRVGRSPVYLAGAENQVKTVFRLDICLPNADREGLVAKRLRSKSYVSRSSKKLKLHPIC